MQNGDNSAIEKEHKDGILWQILRICASPASCVEKEHRLKMSFGTETMSVASTAHDMQKKSNGLMISFGTKTMSVARSHVH
eukprot:scaffold288664_cov18-Tisochrysis_lutea.AAC.1